MALDMGVKFAMVSSPGKGEKTWHVYDGFGDALFDQYLLPKAEELGVEVLNTQDRNWSWKMDVL